MIASLLETDLDVAIALGKGQVMQVYFTLRAQCHRTAHHWYKILHNIHDRYFGCANVTVLQTFTVFILLPIP